MKDNFFSTAVHSYIFHPFRHLVQRLTRHNITCEHTYSTYYNLAPIIVRYLKAFNEDNNMSYPGMPEEVDTMEKWKAIVDKMIWSFDQISHEEDVFPQDEEWYKKVQEGIDLFAKYYLHLWW